MVTVSILPQELKDLVHLQPYPLLFLSLGGAHAYGYASSDSDYDLRGVHILPVDMALGISEDQYTLTHHDKASRLDVDLLTYDIKRYLNLMLEENSFVLEYLYAPLIMAEQAEWEELKLIIRKCLTRNHAYNYLGFAKKQWKLVEKFFPHSVKPFLNSFRILLTGLNLMQFGEMELKLSLLAEKYELPYLDDLIHTMEVKGKSAFLDQEDLQYYQPKHELLLEQLEQARYRSVLPAEPTGKTELNDFLIRIRKKFDC